jgi:hypothetical protein
MGDIGLLVLIDHALSHDQIREMMDDLITWRETPLLQAIRRFHAVFEPYRHVLRDGTWERIETPLEGQSWDIDNANIDRVEQFDIEAIWAGGWGPSLDGPMCMEFTIWRHVCELRLWHVNWRAFIALQTLQDVIRLVCYEFMRVLHGSRVIYLPYDNYKISVATDLLYERDGCRLVEIETWLHEVHGPPDTSIGAIGKREPVDGPNGYFIDTFSVVRPYPV